MDRKEHEATSDETEAQIRVTALSSTMFYMSGRIDAADRRAGTILALSIALIGISLSSSNVDLASATRKEMVCHILQLSCIANLIALGCVISSLWARKLNSVNWVSDIFTGTKTPDSVNQAMKSNEDAMLSGFIEMQRDLADLVMKKNKLSNFGAAALILAAIAVSIGI